MIRNNLKWWKKSFRRWGSVGVECLLLGLLITACPASNPNTMQSKANWPSEGNQIKEVTYQLLSGFDLSGNPVYVKGETDKIDDLRSLQVALQHTQHNDEPFSSIAMGTVNILLSNGDSLILLPVFEQSKQSYGGLFYIGSDQYFMNQDIVKLLEQWRLNN